MKRALLLQPFYLATVTLLSAASAAVPATPQSPYLT